MAPRMRLTEAWYPVAESGGRDGVGPHAVTLFGRDLIMWRSSAAWVASANKCPHAGADLRAASVGDHGLTCSFHGVCFDTDGRAEAPDGAALVLPTLPTHVDEMGVWIWPSLTATPDWVPDAGGCSTSGWLGLGDVSCTVSATVAELFENVVDFDHFRWVHSAQAVPEVHAFLSDGHTLRIDMTHFTPASPSGMRVSLRAVGPGLTITEVGRRTWFRLVSRHLPVGDRETAVMMSAFVRTADGSSHRVGAAHALFDAFVDELHEDNRIWKDRDDSIDGRGHPLMQDTRAWLRQFTAAPLAASV